MKINISQELKDEIDENSAAHAVLTEYLCAVKVDRNNAELTFDLVDAFRAKFGELNRKSFDDLSSYITQLYYDKVITQKEMPVIGEALNTYYYKNREKFVSDSDELRATIEKLYKEICPLGKTERAKYFADIENELNEDKYLKYIYKRVHSCLYPPIMPL